MIEPRPGKTWPLWALLIQSSLDRSLDDHNLRCFIKISHNPTLIKVFGILRSLQKTASRQIAMQTTKSTYLRIWNLKSFSRLLKSLSAHEVSHSVVSVFMISVFFVFLRNLIFSWNFHCSTSFSTNAEAQALSSMRCSATMSNNEANLLTNTKPECEKTKNKNF